MLDRFQLQVLLLGLTLLMLGPTYEASSLGLTVHVVPLNIDGGKTVQAHFSVIAPSPCPSLSGLCAPGEDCLVHTTPLPFTGTKPSDWCVRQWQKTVPSNYSATISLGSNTEFYVSMNAGPKIRANSGRLNQPAFVALPPPLRARVNCSQRFNLSVKDLDGDNVRCRFASSDKGECVNCTQHSFIELDEEKCILSFTGKAPTGQYFIYLMAEDWIPLRRINYVTDPPLSSVPVHLSLTVEESAFTCSDVPVAIDRTPKQDSVVFVLPYQEEKINIDYRSEQESVLELAVVGPPGLYRTALTSVGQLATMAVSWIRSENNLNHLLPICFIANTKSLQSEPRCVWLYQRKTRAPPAGTELKCGTTEMILVLPITSFTNINLAQLQLNSPTCSVIYNNTHLTANISFNGCGTKTVYFGSELIYTNTLKTVHPHSLIIRQPSLILPLTCHIPRAQVNGSKLSINMPTEREAFGEFRVWIEVYRPGEGPLGSFTKKPRFRSNFRARRDANSGTESFSTNSISTSEKDGTRIHQLDLYVRSNTTVTQAEMIVSNCIESETKDFAESVTIVKQGCITSNSTFEIITDQNNTRIYRLDLNSVATKGTTLYLQCTVNLCISTVPSQSCPDLCSRSDNQSIVLRNVFSSTYRVTSGPVSLVVTSTAPDTPAPDTPTPAIPTPATPTLATPAPANPTPDTPTPAIPTPATPTPATPAPSNPAPDTPAPATPAPATPARANPTPDIPTPATTTPANATNTTTMGNTSTVNTTFITTVIISVNATSMPTTTNVTATTVNSTGQSTTSSAPEQASSLAAGVIFTALSIFLQKLVFY